MKLGIAQIRPVKGDVGKNLQIHQRFVELGIEQGADVIVFPELSLTSYEPTLAAELAFHADDDRLDLLQTLSDQSGITILPGLPLKTEAGIHISMAIIQPEQPIRFYAKQLLHADELPYFEPGTEQHVIDVKEVRVAPAICYESLQPEHIEQVAGNADLYLASVAKPDRGVVKAYTHFPEQARAYSMPIVMCNAIGACDDFVSVGRSAVWNSKGELVIRLSDNREGLIVFDYRTEQLISSTEY